MFQGLVNGYYVPFFRIILPVFGNYLLHVIAKGMCGLTGVPFLLPLISSFLSSFWTVLMCFPNSSELYLYSRNCCLSSLQWYSKSCDVVQIRLILIAWMYGILSISDVLNLYEGSSVDRFVFYIFWCKVCCFWYTCLHLEKKH